MCSVFTIALHVGLCLKETGEKVKVEGGNGAGGGGGWKKDRVGGGREKDRERKKERERVEWGEERKYGIIYNIILWRQHHFPTGVLLPQSVSFSLPVDKQSSLHRQTLLSAGRF